MKLGKKAKYLKTIYRPDIHKKENLINLSNNQAAFGKYRKYPYTYPLYEALSKYLEVGIDDILPVKGAEEGLKFVFDAFVEEGMNVIRPNPTFGMIDVYEKYNKAKSIKIDYDEGRRLNLEKFVKKINKNSFIYIANPDNPTGSCLSQNKLRFIVDRAKKNNVLVLLDETYKNYSKYNVDFKNEPNVITVGSFSKSHGLAGIRLGYIVASKELIDVLKRLRPMEEVNSVAVKEGIKALNSNINLKNFKHVMKWKRVFKKRFPTNYIETGTNFILLKFRNPKHISLQQHLYNKGILVKANFNHSSMDGILRITIGKKCEMKKVLKLIRSY